MLCTLVLTAKAPIEIQVCHTIKLLLCYSCTNIWGLFVLFCFLQTFIKHFYHTPQFKKKILNPVHFVENWPKENLILSQFYDSNANTASLINVYLIITFYFSIHHRFKLIQIYIYIYSLTNYLKPKALTAIGFSRPLNGR